MSEDDYKNDELVTVKLPRGDLEIVRAVIEREKAYNWLTGTLKHNWIWAVAGGALAVYGLWDKLHALLIGIK